MKAANRAVAIVVTLGVGSCIFVGSASAAGAASERATVVSPLDAGWQSSGNQAAGDDAGWQ
ncbi:hypothetical protein ACFZAT_10455 [Streptomyces sp. NPDC008163]|uniref:hypothetical protein n=1 Tax=Streptomyces sp. NPDC008163 TaxID=3364818 RepID=UPI0036E7C974